MAEVKLTGINTIEGEYVQGWSTAKFDLVLDSVNSQDWWYVNFYNGGKLIGNSGMLSTLVTSYTTQPFDVTGDVAALVYVVFGGNATLLDSKRFTIQPYSKQTITEILPERPIGDEQTVIVTVTGTIPSLGDKNKKEVTIILDNGDEVLSKKTIVPDSYNFTVSTAFENIPAEETIVCTVGVTDHFGTIIKEVIVPTVSVTMDFHYSGTGVAFGRVAEEPELLDIAWNVRIKDYNLIDFIIERDTDNGWTVEKYASGKIEAYQIVRLSTAVSTGLGGIYYTGSTLSVNLPTCFLTTETPLITATAQSTTSTAVSIHIINYYMNERKISYLITSPFTQSSGTYFIHFRVVGKWK